MFKDNHYFDFDTSFGGGEFPPEKSHFTMTENVEHITREMRATIDRLLKFEQRTKQEIDDLLSALTKDNVLFKNTFNEAYKLFVQEVKNEVNTFKSNTDSSITLFMNSISTDYAELSEDTKQQISDSLNAYIEKLNEHKAELNTIYDEFRVAIENRLEQHNSNYETAFNDYVTAVNARFTAIEKALNADYADFTQAINNSVNSFKNEWTKTIESRLDGQDSVINDAVLYMKTNLNATLTNIVNDMEENGELIGILDSELFIIPKQHGATGDGVTIDTAAVQNMFNAAIPSHSADGYGDTAASVGTKIYFPKGKYIIDSPITISNKFVNIDFGEAIFIKNFEGDYLFEFTAYKNTVTGGVFCGDNIFKVSNANEDQGVITFEHMEFKGCEIAFDVDVMSSKITISDCKFDNVLHPYIGKTDGGTIENCWMTCPVPANNDSNIKLNGGHMYFHNNLLVPIVGDLNGTETAWIENNQRALVCNNNRFGGEEGCRTAVNHKYKFTTDSLATLIFTENLVQAHRDEKSAIRLFTLPNTFVMRDNYYGSLMTYGVSITRTETDTFNSDLTEVYAMYTSQNVNENPFGFPKFRRFRYEVENNFYNTNYGDYMEIERETELWFLLANYSKIDRLNTYCSFGGSYKSQKLVESGTKANKCYTLPLYLSSGVEMMVSFNPNVGGSGYSVKKVFRIYKTNYFDNAADEIKYRFIVEDVNANIYPADINAMVTIGIDTGEDGVITGESAARYGNFVSVKIAAIEIGNVQISYRPI